jgi:putative tricarboxylic transport membrane protein
MVAARCTPWNRTDKGFDAPVDKGWYGVGQLSRRFRGGRSIPRLLHRFRRHLAGIAVAGSLAGPALAEIDLRITVPAAPGGAWDQTARGIEHALLESGTARSVGIINIPGGRGTSGFAEFVGRPVHEPNRVLVLGLPMLAALARAKPALVIESATPIARLTAEYFAIAVPTESPTATARDLAEVLRSDPAKVTWGGGALGSVDHVLAALFAKAAGAEPSRLAYAPFFGPGEMIAGLLDGKITVAIGGVRQFEEQVAGGKLRLIGVTSAARLEGLDAPTLIEQGLDLELANWRGLVAPADVTAPERDALLGMIESMVRSPAWDRVRRKKGWHEAYLSGDAFAAFLREEQARIAMALRSVGLAK